ncbi:MAG: hypothetical protein MUO91_02935 [candidate division Zixibacteria bacterium]|nr:hypothetical protein [candidate division Zixibacteria bacterium]
MGQEILSARGKSAFGRNYPSEDSKLKTEGSFTFLLSSLSSFFMPSVGRAVADYQTKLCASGRNQSNKSNEESLSFLIPL